MDDRFCWEHMGSDYTLRVRWEFANYKSWYLFLMWVNQHLVWWNHLIPFHRFFFGTGIDIHWRSGVWWDLEASCWHLVFSPTTCLRKRSWGLVYDFLIPVASCRKISHRRGGWVGVICASERESIWHTLRFTDSLLVTIWLRMVSRLRHCKNTHSNKRKLDKTRRLMSADVDNLY